jgi:hypothetical protein
VDAPKIVRVRKAKLSLTRIACDAIQVNVSDLTLECCIDFVRYILRSESVTWYIFKILNKNKSHFWMDLLLWKKIKYKINTSIQSSVTSIKRLCARYGNCGNG